MISAEVSLTSKDLWRINVLQLLIDRDILALEPDGHIYEINDFDFSLNGSDPCLCGQYLNKAQFVELSRRYAKDWILEQK